MDIEEDPEFPLTWHQATLLGTVQLGKDPQKKKRGQLGHVLLKPLREQHDHIVAAMLPKHVQYCIIACPHYFLNQVLASSSDMRFIGGKP